MEPMALGSPAQSPKANTALYMNSPFLPSYLMGEQQSVSTPRHTSLSPTKNRSGLFKSPTPSETPERNTHQRILFQNSPFQHELPNLPISKQTVSEKSGPPVQGLFDTLEARYKYDPAVNPCGTDSMRIGTSIANNTNYDLTQYDSLDGTLPTTPSRNVLARQNLNESLVNSSRWNPNRSTKSDPLSTDTWVTVLGFPSATTNMIIAHFGQCGTIVEKKFPSQGNWVHLKYSSQFEANKALSFNGKILGNCIMVGVLPYKPNELAEKENMTSGQFNSSYHGNVPMSPSRAARPLSQSFMAPLHNTTPISDLTAPQTVPQKSTGMVTKAIDYIFGW